MELGRAVFVCGCVDYPHAPRQDLRLESQGITRVWPICSGALGCLVFHLLVAGLFRSPDNYVDVLLADLLLDGKILQRVHL